MSHTYGHPLEPEGLARGSLIVCPLHGLIQFKLGRGEHGTAQMGLGVPKRGIDSLRECVVTRFEMPALLVLPWGMRGVCG